MNAAVLVIVERQPVLKIAVLVLRILVAPDRIGECPLAELEVEVMRRALERTLRRGGRALESVHGHVSTGKVIAHRAAVLIDPDYVMGIGDALALEIDGHSAVEMLFPNLMIGMLAIAGGWIHVSVLCDRGGFDRDYRRWAKPAAGSFPAANPLLRNMVLRGYVVTGPDERSFQLGPQVLKLVQIGCIASDLAKEATSCLQQATRDSGETSAFNQLSAEA